MSISFQRGAFVSEPAILVSRMGHGGQVWSMEKLENKLIDMRDMYEEFRQRDQSPSEIHQETVSLIIDFNELYEHIYLSLVNL